ncbi:MAG: response regulator [Oscillospiraceae bacterium]
MKRIMLIEDEAVIRAGLKKMIEQVIGGYTVCAEAADGQHALRLLERAHPDALVTDIKMAGLDGLAMIAKIRNQKQSLPIIIISGYSDFRYAKTAIEYGAIAYLVKPVDRIELMQALARACPEAEEDAEDKNGNLAVQQAKALIKKQLGSEISLHSIADEIGLNHQYLSALFKNHTGKNFSKFVTEKRMGMARKMLRESNLKIYEVADLCGYRSIKHFNNVFKEFENCTPTEYRNRR